MAAPLLDALLMKGGRPPTGSELVRLAKESPSPEIGLLLEVGLRRKVLDPDGTLLAFLPQVVDVEHILPVAWCLRWGANPNMYVNRLANSPPLHLLAYTYLALSSRTGREIINSLVVLLLLKGSQPLLPVFDRGAGRIRGPGEERTGSNVREWLEENGYWNILQLSREDILSSDALGGEFLISSSVLLDDPSLLPPSSRRFDLRDLRAVLRSRSDNVLSLLDLSAALPGSLRDAVLFLNLPGFLALAARVDPPADLVDLLLEEGRRARTNGLEFVSRTVREMLLALVEEGVPLSKRQMDALGAVGLLEGVREAYRRPYWKKACARPGALETPPRLRLVAFGAGLDPTASSPALCSRLTQMAAAEPGALLEAAKRRQRQRLSALHGLPQEYLGKGPDLPCANRSLLPSDPDDYNDWEMFSYRDDQGSVWCFPSTMFADLAREGVNPYNGSALPPSARLALRGKISFLEENGVDPDLPIFLSEGLKALNRPDEPEE